MSQERTTPEAEIAPTEPVTPEGEPVEAPPTDDRPDQSGPATIAQAEYTRATQLAAAVRKELGLPKTATQAEVTAALAALKAPPPSDDGEDEDEDPRVAEANARARAAELRVQSAVYGEQFTSDAIDLINTVRESDDLEELFTKLAAFRLDGVQPAAEAVDEEPETEDTEQAPGPDAAVGTSEGERTPRPASTPPSGGRPESGVVSAIRGIFAAAGAPPTKR